MESKTKKVTKVGKVFELGERTIYPIVEVSTHESENGFYESLTPTALVVVEPVKKYILPLTEDEIDIDEIIDLVFPD